MFKKILVANRGEIACRVIRTAKRMGLYTIAVYSQADELALHTKLADEAHCIGPATASESYLNIESIITVAKQTQCDAIHPGYGFLSENAEFAKACAKNKIYFIGPSINALNIMGNKSQAKSLLRNTSVPLLPGYEGNDQSLSTLSKQADIIGYPIMLKAAAGGGGKGMRVVSDKSQLEDHLKSAKREALASFSDDTMLIEKYLTQPRHIEIQVFADSHKNIVHLFERDCSIQRRQQKVIEEAPAILLSQDTKEKMYQAAIEVARKIDYIGAGTIEFLVGENENFYFMEMNTRLQVEHPVTEMICNQDLVEWQIKVAAGEALPAQQNDIKAEGHAIEVRLYAEDPQNQFLPAIGKVAVLNRPDESRFCRIDSGISEGDEISQYYDPMLAKLIVWDHNRHAAISRLQTALLQYHLFGLNTNQLFLRKIIQHPDYIDGKLHTKFIANHIDDLLSNEAINNNNIKQALILASAYIYCQQEMTAKHLALHYGDAQSPWQQTKSWRLNSIGYYCLEFKLNQQQYNIILSTQNDCLTFCYDRDDGSDEVKLDASFDNKLLTVVYNGKQVQCTVYQNKDSIHIITDNEYFHVIYCPHDIDHDHQAEDQKFTSPMPGTIIEIMVKQGQAVQQGQQLLTIEAMKMEHTIQAPFDSIVEQVYFKEGDKVSEGVELISLCEEV